MRLLIRVTSNLFLLSSQILFVTLALREICQGNEWFEELDEFGNMNRRHAPDSIMFDLSVGVRQNVPLSLDRVPLNFWMLVF